LTAQLAVSSIVSWGAAKFDNDISHLRREPTVAHQCGIEIFFLRGIVVVTNRDEWVVLERFEFPVGGGNDNWRFELLCTNRILQGASEEKRQYRQCSSAETHIPIRLPLSHLMIQSPTPRTFGRGRCQSVLRRDSVSAATMAAAQAPARTTPPLPPMAIAPQPRKPARTNNGPPDSRSEAETKCRPIRR